VDVRNAIRRLAGDHAVDDVYERYETRQTGDRAVGVALDMSSSMSDVEREAKSALAAFATAVEAVGDEFVAAGYSSKSSRLITGPEERFRPHHLDAVQASGGTPTAAGVDDVLTLLSATRASEQLLFVVTDGAPTTMLQKDAFEESADEVEAMVDRARERGVDVVGVGIGDVRHSLMAQMFGRESYTKTGISNLDDELTAAYRTQTSVTGGVA
jgi:nitric oxide reductase activation protein